MRSARSFPAFVFSAFPAFVLAVGTAQGAGTHSLLPWKTQAGKAFDLMLAGPYACNFSFSHETTYVTPDRIVLAFLATENHAVRCAAPTEPQGPEFRLPALAAGDYPVYFRSLTPCMVGPIVCDIHVEPVLVGTLKVTSGPAYDTGWFLHPKRVESGREASVGLLNPARGSCEYASDPARDTLRFRILELSFHTRMSKDASLCPTSVRPFGPLFHLGDLAPGSYRVEGYDLPLCAFQDPACLPTKPYTPVLVDTLVVEPATALGPVPFPESAARSAPALRRLQGGLGLVWPGREGTVAGLKVERIVLPDGRRVLP
jgi:hypothetical protein